MISPCSINLSQHRTKTHLITAKQNKQINNITTKASNSCNKEFNIFSQKHLHHIRGKGRRGRIRMRRGKRGRRGSRGKCWRKFMWGQGLKLGWSNVGGFGSRWRFMMKGQVNCWEWGVKVKIYSSLENWKI